VIVRPADSLTHRPEISRDGHKKATIATVIAERYISSSSTRAAIAPIRSKADAEGSTYVKDERQGELRLNDHGASSS